MKYLRILTVKCAESNRFGEFRDWQVFGVFTTIRRTREAINNLIAQVEG